MHLGHIAVSCECTNYKQLWAYHIAPRSTSGRTETCGVGKIDGKYLNKAQLIAQLVSARQGACPKAIRPRAYLGVSS